MNAANRTLIVLLLAVAGAAIFWFMMLSPKKDEIATLDEQIAQLNSSISTSQQAAAAGQQAKESFKADYGQLVTLGKAVPDGDEQGALLVQLNQLGIRNETFFSSITMEGSGSATPQQSATAQAPATVQPSATAPVGEETDSAQAAAPATEASVAALPIGAETGSAGLSILPYNLLFQGNFFKLADFIASINGLVTTDDQGQIEVDGRLLTINGFALSPGGDGTDLTELTGNFSVTTFVTPAAQGLMAGATPAGPGTGGEADPVLTGGTP